MVWLGGRLRHSQLTRLNLGGHLSTHDGDDGARPITPDPHLTAKDVPQDWPARGRAVLSVESPCPREKIAGQYVRVVTASKGRYGATHAATEPGELACGIKPHLNAPITEVSREPKDATCRSCRSQLDIGTDAVVRLEALFVLAITPGRAAQAHLGSRRPR